MKKFENVRERVFNFNLEVFKLCNDLIKNDSNRVMIRQLIRFSTSIGANLEEAAGGYTRSDFSHCLNIAKKESREAHYWLRLLCEANKNMRSAKFKVLIQECEEFIKILTASVKKTNLQSL